MRRFFTYRKKVVLLPGQVVRFVKGKGYYAFGKVKRPKPKPTPQPVTMYDSVSVSQIPANAAAVAGYVGGHWPTFPELERSFPHAHKLSIAVNAAQNAECLDVESGDATNDQVVAWVRRQVARGVKRPVVYTSVSNAPAVLRTLQAASIGRPLVRLWTAHYTDTPHRCSAKCGYGFAGTADATQYTSHALGRNLDASLCSPTFFGADV
jgi:hypothetical protein